jgi:uncharacterized protein YndB with AHSA1/START domain
MAQQTEATGRKTTFAAPSDLEIQLTRVFDASPERVFRALTEAEAIKQWWGPRYLTNTVEKMEARPGGVWRIIQRAPDGTVHGFHGVYHDSVAPERIVRTFEYEGAPGSVAMETITLEAVDGGTKVITQSLFQSKADRDGMIGGGAERGVRESHERLDELLAR